MSTDERCGWCGTEPIYVNYHDEEWGVPIYDDKKLFAKLILDGAQAGLAWITILRKRDGYYRAFDGLDPEIIATYSDEKLEELRQDAGIVRNRLKIKSARKNAIGYLKIVEEHGSFSDFLYSFVGGEPRQNRWATLADVPAETDESKALSKALKKYGFSFVGPTIVYAFMQAVGIVNDHTTDCFRHVECREMSAKNS